MQGLSLFVIVSGALVDSINPCAIAVIVFLVTFLFSIRGPRRKVLFIGLTYIFFVFLSYLLMGLGVMGILTSLNFTHIIYKVAAVLIFIGGLINIKDFFFCDKWFSLEIPMSVRPLIGRYIHKASIPAAVVLGILVSLFELPCSGGVYLAILGRLAKSETFGGAFVYLVIYNLIFVMPLVVILVLASLGLSSKKFENWRDRNKRWMKLAIGIAMIVLSIMMLTEII